MFDSLMGGAISVQFMKPKTFFEIFQKKISFSHMKCPLMKHRELLEFLTYSPHASRYKLLKKVESKSDTL